MERRTATVHYRRLDDIANAFNGRTLEGAIRSAMRHQVDGAQISKHWKLRAWQIPPMNEDTILMNHYHDTRVHFFGDLTRYSPGEIQALIQSGV